MREMVFVVFLLLTASGALGDEQQGGEFVVVERWKCYPDGVFIRSDQYTLLEKRKAVATDRIYGFVRIHGNEYVSVFEIDGDDRLWEFGEEFEYSFVITPDGSAAYYDFRDVEEGEKVPPELIFRCSQSRFAGGPGNLINTGLGD